MPTRRFFSRAVACFSLSATVMAGCASSDTDRPEAHEFEAEAFRPLADAFEKVGYRWDWSGFPGPAEGQRIKFLHAWPDAIVTQDTGSKVAVIEPASGRVRWSGEVASRLTRFVGVSRDRHDRTDRLICSSESEVYILDMQTGDVVSRQRYEKVVNTPPLLLGDVGVYGTPNGELLAHRLTNGARAWAYLAEGPIEFPPILADNTVVGATQAGLVSMIDADTGGLTGRARMYGGAAGALATDGALVYIASLDQSIYAFANSGQKIWQHRTSSPLTFAPVCLGARLFCHTADLGFTCFDAGTGKPIWSNREVRGTLIGTRKGDLLVWDGATLSLLEPDRGATVATAVLPGIRHITFDRFDGGTLYVANRAGVVGRLVSKR